MFFRILKKDLKRKRTMNVILFLLIILAAMFLTSSVGNLVTVTGAVDYFIGISGVPDYFAISIPEGEEDAVEAFLERCGEVAAYEVIDTFNITNDRISIVEAQGTDEASYERTNTLCVQALPGNFMKVFDQEDKPVSLKRGEIAFAKLEAEENGLAVGDRVSITVGEVTQEFTIAALTKDAVFGSSMMGFKRLFVSQEDFDVFAAQENLVQLKIYCVNYKDADAFFREFRQQNFNLISDVKKETIPMCYIMEMLMAGILLIVSLCLILIAFLVLRFTIVFTLQEDYREIGIMKAIGMTDGGIKGVYLVKYAAIAVLGAAAGYAAGIPFGEMLLRQALVNMVVDGTGQQYVIKLLCAVGIVGIVLVFCNSSASRLKRFSAIDAIRNGSNGERYRAKTGLRLWNKGRMAPALYMACNDVLGSPGRFAVLGTIFCIGTLLILLPLSAAHTLKSDDIIHQFGLALSDAYIDTGNEDIYVAEKSKDLLLSDLDRLEEELRENGLDVATGSLLGYSIPVYANDPEELQNYYIFQEVGSLVGTYALLDGREPVAENELALTEITAEELGAAIGDSVYFQYPDETQEFIVTGLYQSMMNMGYGIRVSRTAELRDAYISGLLCIQAEVGDMESEEACERIQEIFPDYRILMANEFLDSMIGGIIGQIDTLIYLITGVVLVINSLITVLMMKMLMAGERGDIALLRSIGFGTRPLRMWQTERILFLLLAAILLGTVLAKVLAPVTVGLVFGMMGAKSIALVVNPVETYVVYPLLLLIVTGCSAFLCAGAVGKVDLKEVNTIE